MYSLRFNVCLHLVPALMLISGFIPMTSWAVHMNMCIGEPITYTDGDQISIGSGAIRVFNETNNGQELYWASTDDSDDCYRKDLEHVLTIYPIKYRSDDVSEKDNTLFGWFHLRLQAESRGISMLVMQPFVPVRNPYSYAAGEFVSTSFKEDLGNSGCKETLKLGSQPDLSYRQTLAPCVFATNPAPTCSKGLSLNPLDHSKTFFHNKVYGGYDPEPPKGHSGVICDQQLDSTNTPWVIKHDDSDKVKFPPEHLSEHCYYQAFYAKLETGKLEGKTHYKFVGRCAKVGGADNEWRTANFFGYDCTEHHPGVVGLKPFVPPLVGAGSFRTTHGVAMSLSTMFVIPVGTLFARFFKETHMTRRFMNIHLWHGIHISSALTGFSGLLCGLIAAVISRCYFGYSWHPVANIHVICGWISLILFLASMNTAPIRLYRISSRKLTIFVHFFLASLTRILFAICLLTSFYIAASPSSLYDTDHDKKYETDLVIVVAWIVVDVAVHLFLQCQLSDLSKSWPRNYAFGVPIPLLRPTQIRDAPGSSIRNLLMLSHTVFCFVFALRLSVLMCNRSPEGRVFGKMGYTHKPDGKLNSLFQGVSYNDDE